MGCLSESDAVTRLFFLFLKQSDLGPLKVMRVITRNYILTLLGIIHYIVYIMVSKTSLIWHYDIDTIIQTLMRSHVELAVDECIEVCGDVLLISPLYLNRSLRQRTGRTG